MGAEFWAWLQLFCMYFADGSRNLWHHGESGETCRLAWFWDQELFWLTMFTSQCYPIDANERLELLAPELVSDLGGSESPFGS